MLSKLSPSDIRVSGKLDLLYSLSEDTTALLQLSYSYSLGRNRRTGQVLATMSLHWSQIKEQQRAESY